MDFWASLEHKIYYKYNKDAPKELMDELKEAADTVAQLDRKMENIHRQIMEFKKQNNSHDDMNDLLMNGEMLHIPDALLKHILINENMWKNRYR